MNPYEIDKKHFLKYVCPNPSELGLEVAQFIADLVFGFHHILPDIRDKVDWTNKDYIIVPWPKHHSLHTYDFDTLTRLVVLSHDRMLRVEVNPRAFRWMELVFHKRKVREGEIWARMPTLENHAEKIRHDYEQQPEAELDYDGLGASYAIADLP